MQHLHFGAGGLGLGLITQLTGTQPSKVQVTVVNRTGKRLSALQRDGFYHWHLIPEGSPPRKKVSIHAALDFEDADAISAVVAKEEPILITTALTEAGLEKRVDYIRQLLRGRANARQVEHVYVVPCENTVGQGYRQLESEDFGPTVHFLPCMVDRICGQPGFTKGGEVCVKTEAYASWAIGQDHPHTLSLESAIKIPGVQFVDDLDHHEQKKRWLVNGPHFALGLLAWDQGYLALEHLANSEGGRIFLTSVQEECRQAFLHEFPDTQEDLAEFNERILERFSTFPLPSNRAVGRLRPDNYESLLQAAYDRLVAPAEAFRKANRRCPGFLHSALHILHESIYRRHYVGADDAAPFSMEDDGSC